MKQTLQATLRPAGPPIQQQAVRELFLNRDFKLLWFGQLLSQIGDQCLLIAAITLISNLSQSPLAMLVPALSLAIPQIVFGLVGGAVADPARNAVIPNIVPAGLLLAANSLIQGSFIIALILGPAIAGAAVELWMPSAIIFDSVTFFVSALVISAMNIPETVPGQFDTVQGNNVWEDMQAGLNFIRHNRALRRMLDITAIATLGIGAIVLLAIPHLKTQLGAGGLEYGIAMSMLGLGSVLGGLTVSQLSRRLSTSTTVGGMLILAGAAIVAFAFAPNYAIVLVSLATIGLCVVMARGALDTISQALSPDAVRGRVQSAVNLVVVATTAVAEGLSALLGALIGVQTVFAAAGIVTALTGVAAVFVLRSAGRLVSRGTAVGWEAGEEKEGIGK
jgi:MFS family permease